MRGWGPPAGGLIYFLDADDIMHPRLLEMAVGALRRNPTARFAMFGFHRVSMGEPPQWEPLPDLAGALTPIVAPTGVFRPAFRPETLAVWRFLFRREAVGELRFAPGVCYAEDVDFLFRVFRQSPEGVYLAANLHAYVQSASSISRRPLSIDKVETLLWIVRRLAETYADAPATLRFWRRKLFPKSVKVCYKELEGAQPEVVAHFRAVVAQLFAEGALRLSAFHLKWALRLLPMWWAARAGNPGGGGR